MGLTGSKQLIRLAARGVLPFRPRIVIRPGLTKEQSRIPTRSCEYYSPLIQGLVPISAPKRLRCGVRLLSTMTLTRVLGRTKVKTQTKLRRPTASCASFSVLLCAVLSPFPFESPFRFPVLHFINNAQFTLRGFSTPPLLIIRTQRHTFTCHAPHRRLRSEV